MDKIMRVSEFLNFTMNLPETVFYRGENMDYGETACVAMAIRDATNYDYYHLSSPSLYCLNYHLSIQCTSHQLKCRE